MFHEFIDASEDLLQQRQPFAIAFVVRRDIPSSGKPGDKAVIRQDGTVHGWIGGGCTRGIVLKEASSAMRDGKPRLVRISPGAENEPQNGVIDYKMTCHSGGSVEVYIEPVLPRPLLVVMGKSHVAMALCKLGKAMDYRVHVYARGADEVHFPGADVMAETALDSGSVGPNSCIVVCTQGENDEDALEQAVRSEAPYVAFVSSRRKANAIFNVLRQRGITVDQLKSIKTPAGLDIGAKLQEEVAISILAQVVEFIRGERPGSATEADAEKAENPDLYINPVCGIPVQKSTAKHILEYEGEKVYFCCDGCKVSFEQEPEKYMSATT